MELNSPTVLFVDDEIDILKALKRALRSEPYPCLFANSGEKAIEIMANHPLAVLVTDMRMPQMDGPQLLKYAVAHHPTAIRMVLSGLDDSEDILSAINSGYIYRYIVKPWDNGELKIIVRQAMELFSLQREKQRLMQQLETQNELLEQKVEARTRQLLKISNHAEIGKYASQIVHNMNNPLQVLFGALGFAHKLVSQNGGAEAARLIKYVEMAKKSTNDLKLIIAGILMHARDDGHQRTEAININKIIEYELEFFDINPEFKDRIDKQIELENDLPKIVGNSVQIKQIVDNLIRNAVDAMADSPLKQLRVRTAIKNQNVIIEVGDTGEGIRAEDLPFIFKPDFSTKSMDKGTGLGLASVQTMVASYDGDIQVRSEKGQGATFSVSIPVSPANRTISSKPEMANYL